eukprot:g37220.t1
MSKSRFQEFTLVVSYLLQPRLHQPFASRPDFISHVPEGKWFCPTCRKKSAQKKKRSAKKSNALQTQPKKPKITGVSSYANSWKQNCGIPYSATLERNIAHLTVPELKEECRLRGLKVGGRQDELKLRLYRWLDDQNCPEIAEASEAHMRDVLWIQSLY